MRPYKSQTDTVSSQKMDLDCTSVWRANVLKYIGGIYIMGEDEAVQKPDGHRQFAENGLRLYLSMESKCVEIHRRYIHYGGG